MGHVLGIDLGTTNSVVAIADGMEVRVLADDAGEHLIPSVVSFPESGPPIVGAPARERRFVDAENTVYSVKRLIGRPFTSPEVQRASERFAFRLVVGPNGGVRVAVRGESYALAEISAYVLREVRRVAEHVTGEPCERAVVTVPAAFNELQRSATRAAGQVAGVDILRIIHEPTAAALAYGFGRGRPERVAIYDLGGGTFDITILELEDDVVEVLSTAGDTFLGGDDVDLVVAERMATRFTERHGWDPRGNYVAFERLRGAAEWLKRQLSTEGEAAVEIVDLARGAGDEPLDLAFDMTRADLEEAIRPLVTRSLDVCGDALEAAGIGAGEIDSVVLVGGSTRIPLVQQMVHALFGREPVFEVDPDLVVAQGAAIHAFALDDKRRPGRDEATPARDRRITYADTAAARGRAIKPFLPGLRAPDRQPSAQAGKKAPAVVVGQTHAVDGRATPARSKPAPRPSPGRGDARPSDGPEIIITGLHDHAAIAKAATRAEKAPPSERAPRGDDTTEVPTPGSPASTSMEIDAGYEALLSSLSPGSVEPYDASAVDVDPGGGSDGLPPIDFEDPPDAPSPPHAHAHAHARGKTAAAIAFDQTLAPDPARTAPSPAATQTPARSAIDPALARAAARPVLPMPAARAPLLLDVTPLSLGIETAGGFCQHIIPKNAPIPAEKTRIFTTAQDGQDTVVARVCQGDGRVFADNQALGELELSGLRSAPRGQVHIEVTFLLDANGTLDVRATDLDTGREQAIRIHLVGGLDENELARMRARQEGTGEAGAQ